MTIVGVVGTVKQYGLDIDGRIVVYMPSAARSAIRSRGRRRGPGVGRRRPSRARFMSVDPTIPVFDVRTMTDRM